MALDIAPPYDYSNWHCLVCGNRWRHWGSAGDRPKCEKCEKRREQEIEFDAAVDGMKKELRDE